MKFLPVIILIVLILLTLKPKETPIQPLQQNNGILAFGDSLTYGYHAKPNESYPAVLARLSGHRVINAGIPAETSAEGLRRLPQLLEDERIKLMILFFGGNDIMQRLPMEDLQANLKSMIAMAKAKQIDVLLVSVPNLNLFGFSPLGLYDDVADEENIPLLSGMVADIISQPSLKSDQVHPNAKGYKIMGEQIYEKLKKVGWLRE